ncbi:MAG TPA: leucine-rich repeat domain-containing protein [Phycisphaerae bacterium]|nr:leucine-rich repeat domain-containing protein [Phycisphaerae bacterium]
MTAIGIFAVDQADQNLIFAHFGEKTVFDAHDIFETAILAAWEKAGAQSGWMDSVGHWDAGKTGLPGEVPAFWFKQWTPGLISKLPAPNQNFGLELVETNITDSGLKELAKFTSLQSLDIEDTQVTDAGLKELEGLTQLEDLYISFNQVTDAGLKELKGFKQLRLLFIVKTQVTDAGISDLQKASPNLRIIH